MLPRVSKILAAILIAAIAIAFAPTKDGFNLLISIYEAKILSSTYSAKNSDVAIFFEPSRYSLVDILAHDMALSTAGIAQGSDSGFTSKGKHAQILAQSVIFPASNECIVHASAQTFMQNSGAYAALKLSIPNDRERWSYVLLHEQAHCLWNPTLIAENYLLLTKKDYDIYTSRQFLLAQYLGEAYADSYSLSILLIQKPELTKSLPDALGNWRTATTNKKMHHRTVATIFFTQAEVNKPDRKIQNFQEMHAFALKMSMRGMYYWLLDQGFSESNAEKDVQMMQEIMKTNYSISEIIGNKLIVEK